MTSRTSEELLTEIRRILPLLRHDLRKPEATVRMFVDVLDEIKNRPDQLEKWKPNLLASFDAPLKRLEELERLCRT